MAKRINTTSSNQAENNPIDDFVRPRQIMKNMTHDYLIELMGNLMPGILFLLLGFIAIYPTAVLLSSFIDFAFGIPKTMSINEHGLLYVFTRLVEISINSSATLWFIFFLIFLCVAYSVGSFFFRQDPKIPDKKSTKKQLNHFLDIEIRKTECKQRRLRSWIHYFQFISNRTYCPIVNCIDNKFTDKKNECTYCSEEYVEKLWNEIGEDLCITKDDMDFPYLRTGAYLKKRNMLHLVDFVVWDSSVSTGQENIVSNERQDSWRSKNHINILKMRTQYFAPAISRVNLKNEAHVRFACSMWYVMRALKYIAFISFIVVLPPSLTLGINSFVTPSTSLEAFFWPFFVFIVSLFSMIQMDNFIHYQRIREVVQVLESAYIAFCQHPERIRYPFESFAERITTSDIRRSETQTET